MHRSKSIKYLEVVLHSRLTWNENVNTEMKKGHNLLWACSMAYGAAWGLRPSVVYWPFISINRPSITLASLVW